MANEGDQRRLRVFFYCTDAGHEPVRDQQDGKVIGTDLLRVQEQWPIGMPVCRSLGKGLWEVRTDTARVLCCVREERIGMVHGFIKKTQKTTAADLELARKRMKEMKQ